MVIKELESYSEAFKTEITNSMWDMNTKQLEEELNAILHFANIVYIRAQNADGYVLFDKKKEQFESWEDTHEAFSKKLILNKSVEGEEKFVGEVYFASGDEVVFERVRHNFTIIIINALVKSTLLIVLFILVFRYYLTKPLLSITDQIATLDAQNIDSKEIVYEGDKKDELYLLAETINKTKKALICEMEKNKQKDKALFEAAKKAKMGELLGVIAHQLKQPLTVIGFQTEMLKDQFGGISGISKESIEKTSNAILEKIDYMSVTIDDLRDFFRPNKKKIHFKLRQTVQKALMLLNTQIKLADIKIDIEIPDELALEGYENELLQVIINLVTNARDAIAQNKIPSPTIRIGATQDQNVTTVSVEDNGGGIPKDILEKVFESYFTTKVTEGTGIGLSLSRMIVEDSLGGNITVVNTALGAKFTIVIPNN